MDSMIGGAISDVLYLILCYDGPWYNEVLYKTSVILANNNQWGLWHTWSKASCPGFGLLKSGMSSDDMLLSSATHSGSVVSGSVLDWPIRSISSKESRVTWGSEMQQSTWNHDVSDGDELYHHYTIYVCTTLGCKLTLNVREC